MYYYSRMALTAATLSIILLSASCNDAPKADTATVTTEQQPATGADEATYSVDTINSFVRFTGYGVGKNHPGKFKVTAGNIAVASNQVTGGKFTISINSMTMEQKEKMIESKLKPHLLSKDFFDADAYGTGAFEITKVEPYNASAKDTSAVSGANYNISGNLTLKSVTKNVSFPANITINENMVKANANFNIDRRDWNIVYGSDKSLGDKFISETVNIQVNVAAKK